MAQTPKRTPSPGQGWCTVLAMVAMALSWVGAGILALAQR